MSRRNGELSVTQLAGLLDCSVSSTNRLLGTMLSLRSREELDRYFETLEIRPYQARAITAESVRADVEQAAKTGYATCAEEFVSGIFSISFPLRDAAGDVYALTFITAMNDRKCIFTADVVRDVKARLEDFRG